MSHIFSKVFFTGMAVAVSMLLVTSPVSAASAQVGTGVKLVTPNNNLAWIVNMSPTPNYAPIPVRGPIQAGTSTTWDIQVKNSGSITSDYASYVAPARSNGLGGTVFDWGRNADGTPLASTNELTSWTSITPAERSAVLPGESYDMAVTINIPQDAVNGKYYGVVWSCVKTTPSSGSITMGACAGIRMYIEVTGGTGTPSSPINPDVTTYQQAYVALTAASSELKRTQALSIAAYNQYIATRSAADKAASVQADANFEIANQVYSTAKAVYASAYQRAFASVAANG